MVSPEASRSGERLTVVSSSAAAGRLSVSFAPVRAPEVQAPAPPSSRSPPTLKQPVELLRPGPLPSGVQEGGAGRPVGRAPVLEVESAFALERAIV